MTAVRRLPNPKTASDAVMRRRVAEVVARFEEVKGKLTWPGERDPMRGLVQTLLTHNTTDANAFPAFDQMWERYGSWEAIHHAPHAELAATIRRAGLHNQKAERIQALLGFVQERFGDYTADALKTMDFDEAFEAFGHLAGVKHKTLAVVLCFDLGRDVFAVDTHVHRVCTRIGLVPEKATAVKTFTRMNELVPDGYGYQLHIHMIRHGREICDARKPDCANCFVYDLCRFGRSQTR